MKTNTHSRGVLVPPRPGFNSNRRLFAAYLPPLSITAVSCQSAAVTITNKTTKKNIINTTTKHILHTLSLVTYLVAHGNIAHYKAKCQRRPFQLVMCKEVMILGNFGDFLIIGEMKKKMHIQTF